MPWVGSFQQDRGVALCDHVAMRADHVKKALRLQREGATDLVPF